MRLVLGFAENLESKRTHRFWPMTISKSKSRSDFCWRGPAIQEMLSLCHFESLDKMSEAGPAYNSRVARGPQGRGQPGWEGTARPPSLSKALFVYPSHMGLCRGSQSAVSLLFAGE